MKEGLTLHIFGESYVIGDWVYTKNEGEPIHCVKGMANYACEFYENGIIEIRELYAFDCDFADAFKIMSDWDYSPTKK